MLVFGMYAVGATRIAVTELTCLGSWHTKQSGDGIRHSEDLLITIDDTDSEFLMYKHCGRPVFKNSPCL